MPSSHSSHQDKGTNELEKEAWQFLVTASQWNFKMKSDIRIKDPWRVMRELPKMEVPVSLRMEAKYTLIHKKFARLN